MNTKEVKENIYNTYCYNYKEDPCLENAKKIIDFVDKDYGGDVISERENQRITFPAYGAMFGMFLGMLIFMHQLELDHSGKLWTLYTLGLAVAFAVISIFIARSDGKVDRIYFKAKEHLASMTNEEKAVKLHEKYLGVVN